MDLSWTEITSAQNPTIKEVVRLRQERHRKKQERILVDGIREIRRAVRAGFQLESLFFCDGDLLTDLNDGFWGDAVPEKLFRVPSDTFQKIAFGDRNEGVVAVFLEQKTTLERMSLGEMPLVLVLDGIEKPGNVGAVFRTAAAAGVDAIILSNPVCSPFNANAIRASLGTVFELPFAVGTTEEVTQYLTARNVAIVTTRVDAGVEYSEFNFTQPVAMVLGSEAEGVTGDWHVHQAMTIPMQGSVDSLNISATAAIVVFEARRQRKAVSKSH